MKSKTARRRRRRSNKPQKVNNINKMVMAESLILADPPTRIFYETNEAGEMVAYLCNRTEILSLGTGTTKAEALVEAANNYRDEAIEEPHYATTVNEAEAVKHILDEVPFPALNAANPMHHVCPNCQAGLNEKCVSTRNGKELKNLHVERRRLATAAVE